MQYLNKNRPILINSEIVEWDIRSANLSVIKEFNLLSKEEIDNIPTDSKEKRNIHVGLLMKNNKEFSKALEDSFTKVAKIFMERNALDVDYDVLSIKKDAIFTIAKNISNTKIGNYIEFIPKNTWTSYMFLEPYEFYFIKKNITIKNLAKKSELDKITPLHEKGILKLLQQCISICEKSNMNRSKINSFLSEFVDLYKNKSLDFDFYREFNINSKFKCNMYGNDVVLDTIDESMLDYVNTEFNYINIILPLVRLIC